MLIKQIKILCNKNYIIIIIINIIINIQCKVSY